MSRFLEQKKTGIKTEINVKCTKWSEVSEVKRGQANSVVRYNKTKIDNIEIAWEDGFTRKVYSFY